MKKLRVLLDKAAIAYRSYLDNGKTYKYARQLKEFNSSILELLTLNLTRFPDNLKADAGALIEHIQVWSAKWESLAKELDPGSDDEFVFQNDHRFPREAVERLMSEV